VNTTLRDEDWDAISDSVWAEPDESIQYDKRVSAILGINLRLLLDLCADHTHEHEDGDTDDDGNLLRKIDFAAVRREYEAMQKAGAK